MSLLSRLRILWIGFWSSILGSAENGSPNLVNEGLINQQQRQLQKLRDAIAQLIFQRKRMQASLIEMKDKGFEIVEDLKQAAMEDRDELALELISQQELLEGEISFVSNQLASLEADIEKARLTEDEFIKQMEKTKHQLLTLTSRQQAMHTRKLLRSQLQSAQNRLLNESSTLQSIDDQILKLEAECESLESNDKPWKNELKQLRANRSRAKNSIKLQQLKSEIRKNLLPGRVLIPVN